METISSISISTLELSRRERRSYLIFPGDSRGREFAAAAVLALPGSQTPAGGYFFFFFGGWVKESKWTSSSTAGADALRGTATLTVPSHHCPDCSITLNRTR